MKEKLMQKLQKNPWLAKTICCAMLSHRFCSIYDCDRCKFKKYKNGG